MLARLRKPFRKPSVIPGFGLTLGFTVAYLSMLVLIPFAALGLKASGVGWSGFLTDARVQAAFRDLVRLRLFSRLYQRGLRIPSHLGAGALLVPR